MTRIRTTSVMLYVLGLFLAQSGAFAHDSGSSFLHGLIESDLVLEGSVISVDYALSTPTDARGPRIPHTFVTFQVSRIFKGWIADASTRDDDSAVPLDTLTLRFIGGPAGDDNYLYAFGTPLFDVGDNDLLMVKGNGRLICPLVRCEHGRYRAIDGLVYNNHGHEIVSTDVASVLYGKYHDLRDVLTDQVGPVEIGRGGQIEVDETGIPHALPDFGWHYDIERFRSIVSQTIDELDRAGMLPPKAPVVSQDIREDFAGSPPVPVAWLPEVQEEVIPPDFGFLGADRLEAHFLRSSGGDPVLDPKDAEILSRFTELELRRLGLQELRANERAISKGRPTAPGPPQ